MIPVLYEDKHLIICQKPAGALSEAAEGNFSVANALSEYIGAPVYVVHRLDRNVGGAMLFAKHKSSAAQLSNLIANRGVEKKYLAIVHGCPETPSGELHDLLWRDKTKNKTFVVNRLRKGVKEASLSYKVLQTEYIDQTLCSLLLICLNTGRSHQIRVQFSSRGMPLLGDGKYGSHNNHCEVALWSHSLQFQHPNTKKRITAICNPPEQFPWTVFQSD